MCLIDHNLFVHIRSPRRFIRSLSLAISFLRRLLVLAVSDDEIIYLWEYLDISAVIHNNDVVIIVTIVLMDRCLLVVVVRTRN